MGSVPEPQRWVICPVCHKPNPAGTRFCEHCWGAAIKQDNQLTNEELEELNRRQEIYLERKKKFKLAAAGFAVIALVGAVLLGLFYFTDTIYKPPEDVNSNPVEGDWTMFRRDLFRTGSTGEAVETPEGKLKWMFSTGASVHSSPSVVDGTVYIGSRDYHLYALDAETGEKNWDYKAGSWVESSPAVTDGTVYVGSNDGYLYALDSDTGEKLWDFKTRYPVQSSPAVADGVVYFGSDDYYLYALRTSDGKELWKYDTDSPALSSPAVANGIVYVGSGHGYSYALNAVNGQRRLRYKTHYAVYSSPAVSDNGTVYFATTSGSICAVDGMARTLWREHEIRPWWMQLWIMGVPIPQPPPQSGYLWLRWLGRAQTSSPLLDGDTIYIGSGNRILAVDANTQEILWTFETGGLVRSSPAIAGSVLYVGSEDGKLYAVDAGTGEKLWEYATGDSITSSPAVIDGVVYIGSQDGNVYAIE